MSTPPPRHKFTGHLLQVCPCSTFGAAYATGSAKPYAVRPLDALAIASCGNATHVVGLHLEPSGTWTVCNDCPDFQRIVRLPLVTPEAKPVEVAEPWLRRLFSGKIRVANG